MLNILALRDFLGSLRGWSGDKVGLPRQLQSSNDNFPYYYFTRSLKRLLCTYVHFF